MTDYPERTCEIDNLVRHPKSIEAALSGKKTQQRRDGIYAFPGETFELNGVGFTVTSLEQQKLGEITDADANAEGYPSLEMYKGLIMRMHADAVWENDNMVWVHSFKRSDA